MTGQTDEETRSILISITNATLSDPNASGTLLLVDDTVLDRSLDGSPPKMGDVMELYCSEATENEYGRPHYHFRWRVKANVLKRIFRWRVKAND